MAIADAGLAGAPARAMCGASATRLQSPHRATAARNRPMPDRLSSDALAYHRFPVPGKLAISATKPLASQHDLSLAYSPGVAAACDAIAADPAEAANLTARSNLVAVVTNGTAVLGLGSIGPLAAKPVMEGKAVLFKKFSGIDVFDVEIDEQDPERFCDVVTQTITVRGIVNMTALAVARADAVTPRESR